MTIKRFLFFLLILPFVTSGQSITNINITDSIYCNGDEECVDINVINLNNGSSYDLWIWRDIGLANNQLTDLFEDVTNTSIFNPQGSGGVINYCFELNGNYVVQLKDETSNVVAVKDWETMTWPAELNYTQLSSNDALKCNGDTNGVLKVAGLGGVPPLTYSWIGPNGYQFLEDSVNITLINSLSAGEYVLTLTDKNGCLNNSFVGNVSEPTSVVVSIFQNILESCFDSADAQITAIPSGGNSPYSFLWDSNETTESIITGAGFHAVDVEDSKGCVANTSVNLDVIPQLLVENIQVSDALCVNIEGSVDISVSGGTGFVNFDWPNGESLDNTQNLFAGDYDIIINDSNGCETQATFTVLEKDSIDFSINSVTNASCYQFYDGQVEFQISGGTSNYSIELDGDNNIPLQYFNILSEDTIIESLGADDYQVLITDANGCTNNNYMDSISVFEPSDITVSDTLITNVLCFNNNTGSIQTTISGGSGVYTYLWVDSTNTSIGTNDFIADVVAGTYTLTVNDGICTKDFSFEITQPSFISIQTSPLSTDISCFGLNNGFITNTIVQGGLAPYNYIWKNDFGNIYNEANPNSLPPSTYTLEVTDSNECSQFLTSLEIGEPTKLEVNQFSTFSQPSCFNIQDGSIDVSAIGGIPNYSYLLEETNSGALYFGNEINTLSSGNYNLKITDANSCEFDTSFTFENPADLVFTTNVIDLNCYQSNDGMLVYNYDEINPPYTLYFNVQQVLTDSVINLAAGIYSSTLVDSKGCEKSIIDTIIQPNPLDYSSTVSIPSCSEDNLLQNSLISNGQIELNITGGSGNYDVISNLDTNQIELGIPLSISNLSSGSYDFQIVDSQGCSLNINETIGSPSAINAYSNITDIVVYGNSTGSIDVSISGGELPYQTSWTSPGFIANSEDISNLSAGLYTITVIDGNGCYEIFDYPVNQGDCNIIINPDTIYPKCHDDNAQINFELIGGLAPYNCYMQGDIDGDDSTDFILPNTTINSTLANYLTVTPGTTYNLVVKDAADCYLTYNFIVPKKDSLVITPQITNASCYGDENGKIIIDTLNDISGGTAPYTIEILGLDLSPVNPNILSSGEYVVKISDALGCQKVEFYTVDEPSEITLVEAIISQPNCLDKTMDFASDGDISIIAQGGNTAGTGLYTYSWVPNTLPSLQNVENLSPGLYSVTIGDQTNCQSQSYSFTLESPELIQYENYSSQDISCHNSCDGSFTVITENAENEVFYWYDASDSLYIGNTNSVNNLCAGSYFFAIENNQNCYVSSPALGIGSLTLQNPAEFNINIVQSPSVPNGICDGIASVTSTSGVEPVTFQWSTGESISTIESLCGGNIYNVIANDANGCQSSKQFVINEEECSLSIGDLMVIQPSCNGVEDGKIISSNPFVGGYPPYTIYFYENDIPISEEVTYSDLINFSNLSEGTYNIIVKDIGGCLATFNTTINNPPPLSYAYSIENVNCFNSFDPEVILTITGGTPFDGDTAYDVDFFDFEHTLTFENGGIETFIDGNSILPGSYTLIVKDSNNCTSPLSADQIFTVDVSDIDSILVNVQTTSPRCNGEASGKAILSYSGGQGPFEINWYAEGELIPFNDSSLILNNLSAGNYYVSIKDNLGCQTTTNFSITDISDFSVFSQISTPSCVGESDGSISTAISGSNGGFSYLWSPGSMLSNNVSSISKGSYELIITDQKGCEYKEVFDVNDPEEIVIDLDVNPVSCFGFSDGSISATATLGAGNYNYQWYLNGGLISSINGGVSPDIINLSPANYSIKVTDALGCSSVSSASVSEPSNIELNIDKTNPTCYGYNDGSVIVNVSGGTGIYLYNLSDDAGNTISEEYFSNNLASGNYEIRITDSSDCKVEESIVINDPNAIQLFVSVQDVQCNGGTTGSAYFSALNNSGDISHVWSSVIALNDYQAESFADTLTNIDEGNYILEVEDEIGCTQSELFTVAQANPIEISVITTPSSCSNVSGATAEVSSNAASPVNYIWTINQDGNTTQFGTIATDLKPGVIFLNGTDANGCALPLTSVEVPPSSNSLIQVQIDQLVENDCYNDAVAQLEAVVFYDDNSSVGGNVFYQWYFNGEVIPTSQGGSINILSNVGPGQYSIEVIDENLGCVNSDTIELFNSQEINIDLETQDINCFGDNSGIAIATVTNGVSPYSFEWNNTMGVDVPFDIANPDYLLAGIYELIVTDDNGCKQSQTFEILQYDSLSLNLNSKIVSCFGGSNGILFSSVTGGYGDYTYEWKNENNVTVSFSPSIENLSAQTFSLLVSDELECTSTADIILEEANPIVVQDNIINVNCYGDTTGSVVINVSGGTGEFDYEWNSTNLNTNQLINLGAGIYSVNIIDENSCKTSRVYTVDQPTNIQAYADGIFQSCSEGIINISSVDGGTPPYSYFWVDDPTNESMSISGMSPGYHTFYVFDSNDCIFIDSALISGSNEILTSINVESNVQCFGDSSGQISLDIINVNEDHYPYTFSINDALNFNDTSITQSVILDNLPSGSYTIFIKDGEDCIDTSNVVFINQPSPLEVSFASTEVFCFGNEDGTISVSYSGGVQPYDISLDDGISFEVLDNDGAETFNVFSGDYSVVIADKNGCTVSENLTISQPELLNFSVDNFSDYNGFNVSCYNSNNGSLSINLSGGIGEYELSFHDTSFVVTDGTSLEGLSSGLYNFMITDENECSFAIDTVITAADTLLFGITDASNYNGFSISCFGSTDAFINSSVSGGVGPYDYSFNGGITYVASNTINQFLFENLSSGETTFQVKDDNECIKIINYDITSPGEIIPSLSLYSAIDCNGNDEGALLAGVDGGVSSFTFELAAFDSTMYVETSSEPSFLFDNLSAGFYELNIIDQNGCSNLVSNSSQFIIDQPDAVIFDLDIEQISCNSFNDASIEVSNISGGIGAYSFKLYNSFAYYFAQDGLGSFDLLAFDSLNASSYVLIISDENNCEFIDTLIIENPEILSVNNSLEQVSCYNTNTATLELFINGGSSPYSIYFDDEVYTSSDSLLIEDLQADTYNYLVVDDNGCEYSTEETISQPDSLIIEASIINNLCFNQSFGSVEFNSNGGTSPYSYQFTSLQGILISDSSTVINLSAGTYYVNVVDSNNCSYSQEVVISEASEILINHNIIDESCPDANDGNIISFVSNYQDSFEIFWSDENLSGLENSNINPGDYTLTVVDNLGCFKVDTITIESATDIEVLISTQSSECTYTNDGELYVDFSSQENFTLMLSNENDSYTTSGNSQLSFQSLSAGDYNLSIIDDSNCSFDTTANITSDNGFDCIVPEPTFSPNYDGVNEVFSPTLGFNETVELFVFNRWGSRIFYEQSISPTWDGTDLNGKIVPSSDYYYIIKFNNALYNDLTGIITLLK